MFHFFLLAQTVYLTNIGGHEVEKLFFDPYSSRDEVAKPFVCLRQALEERGYVVRFIPDSPDVIREEVEEVVGVISLMNDAPEFLRQIAHIPLERRFLVVFESPIVQPSLYHLEKAQQFGKIFTMADALIDGSTWVKLHYPQPRLTFVEGAFGFAQRKLCVMIAANKDFQGPGSLYSERRKIARFFCGLAPDSFDMYGSGWEKNRCWKGLIPAKWDVLKTYRFAFCYENTTACPGYITEKIFDAMVSQCIPVYLGAANITEYIPKNCFIDRRDFSSLGELFFFLEGMTEAVFEEYLEAMQTFLKSPQAQKFSIESFISTIVEEIEKVGKRGIRTLGTL